MIDHKALATAERQEQRNKKSLIKTVEEMNIG
jgi:hypothetical protein